MAKKFGKLVVFGLVAGAAAAGVYHYVQNQKKTTEEFDDFDNFDDNDPVVRVTPKREYVSLDSAKTFVSDTFEKAKDTISGTINKVSKKFGNNENNEDNENIEDFEDDEDFDFFDDLSEEQIVASTSEKEIKHEVAETKDTTSTASDSDDSGENIEEFFDDEDEE